MDQQAINVIGQVSRQRDLDTAPHRRNGGQTTVELMVIMAIGLVVVASLVGFVSNQIVILQQTQAQKTAQASMNDLIAGVNEVYAQGPGAAKQLTVIWPTGIDTSLSSIANKTIRLRVYNSDIVGVATPYLTGSLPTNAGTQRINIRAADGYVSIGTLTLSATPTSVYLPMARDQNSSSTIQLHSTSSTSATITPALNWSPTLVTAATDTAPFSLSSAADINRDVNVSTGSLAVGNYSGSFQVSASFSDHLESLRIPIAVDVLVNTGTLLTPYPTSLTINTLWDDTNSSIIQLCNLGNIPIKSISFTPSTGNAGDWVQGIASIDQLNGQTCTNTQVIVTPPLGTGLGTYYGTIVLRDFDGSNSLAIPLTVNVLGMSGAFAWDWNVAALSNTSISGFGMANTGSHAITLTSVTLSGWSTCDSNQNTLSSIVFNGSTRFSGTSADGEVSDINDFSIPVLAYYTNNFLYFSGRINDENESFVAVVDFSDGTSYTSATFGSNTCSPDVIPPANVSDMTAVPGPSIGSVRLEFTMPGDDAYVGRVADTVFRYRAGRLNDAITFGLGMPLYYDFNNSEGGLDVSVVVYDVNINNGPYFFGARFNDEVPNYKYANNPQSSANNTVLSSDFNFPHMVDSNRLDTFYISGVVPSAGTFPVRKIRLRIQEDGFDAVTPHYGRWYVDINFMDQNGTTPINFIKFSYTDTAFLEGPVESDWNTGPMNDLTPVDIMGYELNWENCTSRSYSCLNNIGGLTGINKPNHMYLDEMIGIDEFALTVADLVT